MEKLPFCYQYPRPALGIDCLIVRPANGGGHEILLIERGNEPFKGCHALPGGFFDMEDDNLEHTAARELEEETGLKLPLQLLGPFSNKHRDPRERTVTIAWYGLADAATEPVAGDDAASVSWHPLDKLPALAFDHDLIINTLREKLGM